MSKLLRYFEPGQTVFLTVVTKDRQPFLLDNESLLITALRKVFGTDLRDVRAWVILPDHFYAVIDFPRGNVSNAVRRTELVFGAAYRRRQDLYRATVWQKRYWDHVIRDDTDLKRHIDYTHYNPVKHDFASNPFTYRYSSASTYLENGLYEPDWGRSETLSIDGDFGE